MWRLLAFSIVLCAGPAVAAANEAADGKVLLESNCGRCHGVTPGAESPVGRAPNLSIVLQSYPKERLETELAEGIRSSHRDMPQVSFSLGEISNIYVYLHGELPDAEERHRQ